MAWGLMEIKSLTMTYFHTGIRTIIGAEAFHCPVRDGKEWYHLAMVIRHNRLPQLNKHVQLKRIHRVLFSVISDCAFFAHTQPGWRAWHNNILFTALMSNKHQAKVIGSSLTSN